MTKRGLNHTCNRWQGFSCCVRSSGAILSPGIILLRGRRVTNCLIYQNKTALCNSASLLLCIHQNTRNTEKAQMKASLGDSMIWSWLKAGIMGTSPWHVLWSLAPLCEQGGIVDPACRSSWTCYPDKPGNSSGKQPSSVLYDDVKAEVCRIVVLMPRFSLWPRNKHHPTF